MRTCEEAIKAFVKPKMVGKLKMLTPSLGSRLKTTWSRVAGWPKSKVQTETEDTALSLGAGFSFSSGPKGLKSPTEKASICQCEDKVD